jgi:hypothetical protein
MQQHLTRIEQANLIAGHAVGYATAFLDGRHSAQQLGANADRLLEDIFVINGADTNTILVPVRMLADAMKQTAMQSIANTDQESLEGWQRIVAALVELVMKKSRNFAKERA